MRVAYITHDSLESTAVLFTDAAVEGGIYPGLDKWSGRPITVRAMNATHDVPYVEVRDGEEAEHVGT